MQDLPNNTKIRKKAVILILTLLAVITVALKIPSQWSPYVGITLIILGTVISGRALQKGDAVRLDSISVIILTMVGAAVAVTGFFLIYGT